MIAWSTIRPGLLGLFNNLSGGIQTVWIDKRQPYTDPKGQAIVKVRPRSVAGIGVDDRRYTDLGLSAPEPTCEETQNGHRRVSFDVRVESFRHDDDRFAFHAAEAIRIKLGFGSSLARLLALNIALVRVSETLDLSGVVKDSRVVSVAVLDLILNIGATAADTDNPLFNIETVDNPVDHPSTVIT